MLSTKTRISIYVIVFFACALTLFPVIWALYNSFLREGEILGKKILSLSLSGENYQKIIGTKAYLNTIKNSAIASSLATLISIIVGALGAYGLVRLKRGEKTFAFFLLIFRMLPGLILIIPFYVMFSVMNLLDTYWALILMYLTLGLPFAAWMLRGFFMGVPREIMEAARLDGCSEIKIFWRIILPITKPGIWATAIITYLFCWNDFLYALIVTDRHALTFLPFLTRFLLPTRILYGPIYAGTMFFILPVLIALILVRKDLTEKFALGLIPK